MTALLAREAARIQWCAARAPERTRLLKVRTWNYVWTHAAVICELHDGQHASDQLLTFGFISRRLQTSRKLQRVPRRARLHRPARLRRRATVLLELSMAPCSLLAAEHTLSPLACRRLQRRRSLSTSVWKRLSLSRPAVRERARHRDLHVCAATEVFLKCTAVRHVSVIPGVTSLHALLCMRTNRQRCTASASRSYSKVPGTSL